MAGPVSDILFMTLNNPLFGKAGQHLRTRAALQMLSSFARLTLLSHRYTARIEENYLDGFDIDSGKIPADQIAFAPEQAYAPGRGLRRLYGRVFSGTLMDSLLRPNPEWTGRFRAALTQRKYQLAWLDDDGFLGHYVSRLKKTGLKVILNTHNVQSCLEKKLREKDRAGGWGKRFYDALESGMEALHERIFFPLADGLCYCNPQDLNYYQRLLPPEKLFHLPNVTLPGKSGRGTLPEDLPGRYLVWAGCMDVRFHAEGLRFFTERVWPQIAADHPDLWFVIAGYSSRGQSELLRQWPIAGRIKVCANPDDIRPVLGKAEIMVVPLFQGGGTRIKILDAGLENVPVVSTAKGAEGLGLSDGKEILIADSSEDFIRAIRRLLQNPGLGRALAGAARAVVETRYVPSAVAPDLKNFVEKVLSDHAVA